MKKETSFEEKLSGIMKTFSEDQAAVLPDLTSFFQVGGYDREVEDEEQYQLYLKVRDEVSQEAEEKYQQDHDGDFPAFGACHVIWAIEKQIYRERYGIEWHSPQEMHPEINYD